jgi:hypothetical protein
MGSYRYGRRRAVTGSVEVGQSSLSIHGLRTKAEGLSCSARSDILKFSMRHDCIRLRVVWHVAIALILVILLCLIGSPPAAAQIAEEYFQISYEPVSFSKTEIHGDEVFSATVQGRATCIKDLPMSVSEARITGHVIAEHTVSGTKVTLNSSYTTTIRSFPGKAGDTIDLSKVIYLQFPNHGESGDYDVIDKLDKVEIPFLFGWVNVTSYLPEDQLMGLEDQLMGSLKYIPGSESPTPTPTPIPTPIPTPTPTPTPTATSEPSTAAGLHTGTWVGIGIAVIISISLALGIWLIVYRRKKASA